MQARAAEYAVSQAASNVSSTFRQTKDRAANTDLDWTDLNWPCRKEPFGILHFDLAELKEKKGEEAFKICRMMYAWWFLVVFLVSWNFISAIAITAAVGDNDIYHGINIFYSLLMFIIGTVISALSFYKTYETLGDDYDKQKKYAQGSLVLTCIFMIIVTFVGDGNANGFATFATSAYKDADDKDLGIVPYWTAVAVIEPLLWIVATVIAGYGIYRVRIYPSAVASSSNTSSSV